jgi:hypothetical protein
VLVSNSLYLNLKIKELKFLPYLFIFLLVFMNFGALELSINRQFDTQFFGLDVAGEYIKAHSSSLESIIDSGHQDIGLVWHSDRRLVSIPPDVSRMQELEEKMHVRWIFVYQWGFNTVLGNAELAEYIYDNYRLAQIAFRRNGENVVPFYFLLEKGGSFNQSDINNLIQNKPVKRKYYELTSGNVELNYVDTVA